MASPRRIQIANAATEFHGEFHGCTDRPHRIEIALLASKRRIEVHDVQIIAPLGLPPLSEGRGVARIDGVLVGFALAKSDDFAGHEVDGRQEEHGSGIGEKEGGEKGGVTFHEFTSPAKGI